MRDTGIQVYSVEEQRLNATRHRAHMELLEMNARIADEWAARYRARHCPPADVLSGRRPSRAREDRAPSDSARGTIILCGPEGHPLVTLIPRRGRSIALAGNREPIALMSGLEVTVFGMRSSGGRQHWPRLEVRRAVVRATAGRPAHDGILRREPDGDYLELADGRRLRIPVLPTLLEPANGLRVWMIGPPSDSKTGEVLVPWRDELYRRRPETDSSTAPKRSP